jgi:hypothetical protein
MGRMKIKFGYIGFEDLTAVVMKNTIFWDITQSSACHLLSRWFLLGLFSDPEDVGDVFLRNVG